MKNSTTPTCALDFYGAWRGPVRPIAKTYEIGVTYFPRVRFGGAVIANPWVTVEVLAPRIGLDPTFRDSRSVDANLSSASVFSELTRMRSCAGPPARRSSWT